MTIKTIKTILFASLIAAMILPFSGMMMVEAAQAEKSDDKEKEAKIAKIKQSIIDYEKQEKKAKDNNQKEKLRHTIDILNVIVDLEELDRKGLGNSALAQSKVNLVNTMIDEKYEIEEGTLVDPKDIPAIHEIDYENQFIPLAFASNTQYDTYTTTQQVTQSCGNTVTGQTNGFTNQYSSYSYVQVTSNYPSSLHCNPYAYKDTTVQFTKIGLGQGCTATMTNNSGTSTFYCNSMGTINDPSTTTIFVSGNSYYDWGWVYFTAIGGWATIVY